MKLITNDASKNADNKEITRLKGVSFHKSDWIAFEVKSSGELGTHLLFSLAVIATRAALDVMKAQVVSALTPSVGKISAYTLLHCEFCLT